MKIDFIPAPPPSPPPPVVSIELTAEEVSLLREVTGRDISIPKYMEAECFITENVRYQLSNFLTDLHHSLSGAPK